METNLLTRQQLEQKIQLSRSQIYSLVAKGQLPAPLKIGQGDKGAVRWRLDEIEAWLSERPRSREVLPKYRAA